MPQTVAFNAGLVEWRGDPTGAELLALSGKCNPYPGKLGVIEKGALAHIVLVNSNPPNGIWILTKLEENLAFIMKDRQVYEKTIS